MKKKAIDKNDIKLMFDDIAKMLTYGMIIHILTTTIDDCGEVFDEKTLKVLLYGVIAMTIYHLVLRRFIL